MVQFSDSVSWLSGVLLLLDVLLLYPHLFPFKLCLMLRLLVTVSGARVEESRAVWWQTGAQALGRKLIMG